MKLRVLQGTVWYMFAFLLPAEEEERERETERHIHTNLNLVTGRNTNYQSHAIWTEVPLVSTREGGCNIRPKLVILMG